MTAVHEFQAMGNEIDWNEKGMAQRSHGEKRNHSVLLRVDASPGPYHTQPETDCQVATHVVRRSKTYRKASV